MFAKIDVDGNGLIEYSEFHNALAAQLKVFAIAWAWRAGWGVMRHLARGAYFEFFVSPIHPLLFSLSLSPAARPADRAR